MRTRGARPTAAALRTRHITPARYAALREGSRRLPHALGAAEAYVREILKVIAVLQPWKRKCDLAGGRPPCLGP